VLGKINMKGVFRAVREAKLKMVEIIAQHSGSVTIMKWDDKRDVIISTFHDTEMKTEQRRGKTKPKKVC
jgi:hypothetical protein